MIFSKDSLQKSKWRKLHENKYHPSIEKIIERINEHKSQNIWLFKEWEQILNMQLPVQDKIVLEIGCGGGWYLAQMLYQGAKKVIGIEIDKTIIDKANEAFKNLGLKNYDFHEIDESFFNFIPSKSVDVVYEMTVFQHIFKEITLKYLQDTSRILKDDGIMLAQFLMNDSDPVKNPSPKKEGIMYYSHKEVLELARESGLQVDKFANYEWTDGKGSYWRIYVFKS